MPKLNTKVQRYVDKQEASFGSSGFEVIPDPKVIGTLEEVREEEGKNGVTRWVLVFGSLVNLAGKEYSGKLFHRLSIPGGSTPPAEWRVWSKNEDITDTLSAAEVKERWLETIERWAGLVRGFFEVVGYTTDSDTDEMVGEKFGLNLVIEGHYQDKTRKVNRVTGFFDLRTVVDGADLADDAVAAGGDDDEF